MSLEMASGAEAVFGYFRTSQQLSQHFRIILDFGHLKVDPPTCPYQKFHSAPIGSDSEACDMIAGNDGDLESPLVGSWAAVQITRSD